MSIINVFLICIVMEYVAFVHRILNIGIIRLNNVLLLININQFATFRLLTVVIQVLVSFVKQPVVELNVLSMQQSELKLVIVSTELIGMVDRVYRKKRSMMHVFGIVNVIEQLAFVVSICHVFVQQNIIGHQ